MTWFIKIFQMISLVGIFEPLKIDLLWAQMSFWRFSTTSRFPQNSFRTVHELEAPQDGRQRRSKFTSRMQWICDEQSDYHLIVTCIVNGAISSKWKLVWSRNFLALGDQFRGWISIWENQLESRRFKTEWKVEWRTREIRSHTIRTTSIFKALSNS